MKAGSIDEDKLIELGLQLRAQDQDYGQIRQHLRERGCDEELATYIIRKVDEAEVHEVVKKRRVSQAFGIVVMALLLFAGYLSYDLFLDNDRILALQTHLWLSAGVVVSVWYYRRIRSTFYSDSVLYREMRNQKMKSRSGG